MTQAIIYCRFSPRPDANTSTSNERQEERCVAYCKHKGYDVTYCFQDKDISGGVLDRPGLNLALGALHQGMILVVDSSERLARDIRILFTIEASVIAKGARIEFADGTPSSETPEGELIGGVFALFAQYQRKCIKRKTKAGLARKRDSGVYLGKCPIGYKRNEQGKLVRDYGNEWSVVEYLLSLHHQGCPIQYMLARLAEVKGNIRGKPWNERTIRRIIQREKKTLDNVAGA